MLCFKPLTLPCTGTPAQIAQRLHALAAQQGWQLGHGPRGAITLRKPSSIWLYSQMLDGLRITPREAPTPDSLAVPGQWQIRGHFRPSWLGLAFMLAFDAFMLHTLWQTVQQNKYQPLTALIVLGFLIGIPVLDWASHIPLMRRMHSLLQQSLQAPVAP